MCSNIVSITCILLILLCVVEPAKILEVFPMPSVSHQGVFRAYANELAERGHEVVVLTPFPSPKEKLHKNIKEIQLSVPENILPMRGKEKQNLKRGIVSDMDSDGLAERYIYVIRMMAHQFSSPEIKQFVTENKDSFDLVVAEVFLEFPLLFSYIFKVPTIAISSFYGFPELYDAVGSTSRHPIFYPHLQRTKFRNLTLWEKVKESYAEYKLF